ATCGMVRAGGGGRDAVRALDQRDLFVVLPLAEHFDEVHGRSPLPSRAGVEQSLKVAVQQVPRLESGNFDIGELRELLPKSDPQALRLDANSGEVTDLLDDL